MSSTTCPICGNQLSGWSNRCATCGYDTGLAHVEIRSEESNAVFDVLGAVAGGVFGVLGAMLGGVAQEIEKEGRRSYDEYRLQSTIERAIRNTRD